MPESMGLIYAVAYLFVTLWNAMPDGVHFGLYHQLAPVWDLLRLLGYIVYEDGSVGW
jgi:hypothetical protein